VVGFIFEMGVGFEMGEVGFSWCRCRNLHGETLPSGLLGHICDKPHFRLKFRNVLCAKPCIGHNLLGISLK